MHRSCFDVSDYGFRRCYRGVEVAMLYVNSLDNHVPRHRTQTRGHTETFCVKHEAKGCCTPRVLVQYDSTRESSFPNSLYPSRAVA